MQTVGYQRNFRCEFLASLLRRRGGWFANHALQRTRHGIVVCNSRLPRAGWLGGTTLMPRWLQGMTAPTLMLWFFAVAFGIASALGPAGAQGNAVADRQCPKAILPTMLGDGKCMSGRVFELEGVRAAT